MKGEREGQGEAYKQRGITQEKTGVWSQLNDSKKETRAIAKERERERGKKKQSESERERERER